MCKTRCFILHIPDLKSKSYHYITPNIYFHKVAKDLTIWAIYGIGDYYDNKGFIQMGRKAMPVDKDLLLDLLADGMSKKDIAAIIGCSAPTVDAKIAELQKEEASLLAYDKNKHLDLIGVQQRILANVTDEKLAEAPVQHLASAYTNFGKMLQLSQGKPTEITGLMGYLMKIEQEDIDKRMAEDAEKTEVKDAEYEDDSAPKQLELF